MSCTPHHHPVCSQGPKVSGRWLSFRWSSQTPAGPQPLRLISRGGGASPSPGVRGQRILPRSVPFRSLHHFWQEFILMWFPEMFCAELDFSVLVVSRPLWHVDLNIMLLKHLGNTSGPLPTSLEVGERLSPSRSTASCVRGPVHALRGRASSSPLSEPKPEPMGVWVVLKFVQDGPHAPARGAQPPPQIFPGVAWHLYASLTILRTVSTFFLGWLLTF